MDISLPDRLATNNVAADMYIAPPAQLMDTLNGTTNPETLLSILFFTSQE